MWKVFNTNAKIVALHLENKVYFPSFFLEPKCVQKQGVGEIIQRFAFIVKGVLSRKVL